MLYPVRKSYKILTSVTQIRETQRMHFLYIFTPFEMWRSQIVVFIYSIYLIKTSDGFNIMVKDAPVFTGGHLADSYFGYTIAIHSDVSNKWIFVGAPRDNDTELQSIDRPGVLYKCQINNTQCQSIVVDANTNIEDITAAGQKRTVLPGKNGQWLGGALDIDDGNVFVCAHRWYNQSTIYKLFQNGICYESEALKSTNWTKYPLLTLEGHDYEKRTGSNGSELYYIWGFGSLGMAVHFIGTNYADVLIGTPGVHSWTGGFVRLGTTSGATYSEKTMLSYGTSEFIGYALSSGKYFGGNEIYFAAGGPRYNLTGAVLFFKMSSKVYNVNEPFLTLYGNENGQTSQLGGYFGSALVTVDVNKDNLDDLLVGAPMFTPENTSAVEEGRVFVYLGSSVVGQFKLQLSPLEGSGAQRARFGSAITNLGDINKDQFPDVAIGSPFEDEGVGAVYIYNGYTEGLWDKFTQRISGKAVQSGLKGFGISFSRATDTNGDGTNDVAVGAFLSGNVVLLQSQPVIQLRGEIVLESNRIGKVLNLPNLKNYTLNTGRQYPYFEFQIKFTFSKSDVIRSIVLNVTARVDTLKERPRFSFLQSNETLEATYSISIEEGNIASTPIVKVLVKSTADLVTPIRFYTKYELHHSTLKLWKIPLKPTLNLFDGSQANEPTNTITKQIEFQKDCQNNECNTDLHLSVTVDIKNDSELIIDELEFLKLNVSITKTGDPAYGTGLTIVFPKTFKYKNVEKIEGETDIQCSFDTEESNITAGDAFIGLSTKLLAKDYTVLLCSYGNPMKRDDGVKFQVYFVPSVYFETSLHFIFKATTQSKEKLCEDNNATISLIGKRKVVTTFKGLSKPDSISMRSGKDTYEVTHTFDLHNQGPSSLLKAIMFLKYPYVAMNGKSYLRLVGKPNINSESGSSVSCEKINTILSIPTTTGQIQDSFVVIHSDCSRDNCTEYKCSIKNIPPRTSAVINLALEINFKLPDVLQQTKSFSVTSTATVIIENSTNTMLNTWQHATEIRTRLIQMSPPPEPIAWWIIFVSVLGGILLIVILVLILWKCGFFKRKKREEMEKRKAEETKILVKSDEINSQETKDEIKEEMTEKENDVA